MEIFFVPEYVISIILVHVKLFISSCFLKIFDINPFLLNPATGISPAATC